MNVFSLFYNRPEAGGADDWIMLMWSTCSRNLFSVAYSNSVGGYVEVLNHFRPFISSLFGCIDSFFITPTASFCIHRTSCCLPLSSAVTAGFWKTKEELKKLQSTDEAFLPKGTSKSGAHSPSQEYIPVLQSWERAIQRSMNWYKPWYGMHTRGDQGLD